MILVFHSSQYHIQPFLNYLEKQQINHISLDVQELIRDIIIEDTCTHPTSCLWTYKDQVIDFSKLTGIYNAWQGLEVDSFNPYVLEDQSYVNLEWTAYICFHLNNFTNCINKPTKEKNCGIIYQIPFLMERAKQAGFNTPSYFFSTERNLLINFSKKNRYISLQKLYLLDDYQESSKVKTDSIGILEYIEGDMVILYIIGEQVFSWVKVNNLDFEILKLPTEVINATKKMIRNLQLRVAEIRLIRTQQNNFIFYWFSSFPIWTSSQLPNLDLVFNNLTKLLLSDQCKLI